MSDMQFTITRFRSFGAGMKSEQKSTLADLANLIQTTRAPTKAELPWLKLAAFGDKRTEKGSLRHDGNVKWISGIEADYDAEQMPFDDAVGLLESHCIMGLLLTPAHHTRMQNRAGEFCAPSRSAGCLTSGPTTSPGSMAPSVASSLTRAGRSVRLTTSATSMANHQHAPRRSTATRWTNWTIWTLPQLPVPQDHLGERRARPAMTRGATPETTAN